MELIKDLPEVFEEFAEQRQKSFLAVKELKEKGVPVVGSYCTYFPKEIAMAMGCLLYTSENEFYAKWLMEPDNLQSLTNTLRYHVICPADMQIRVRYEAKMDEQEKKERKKKRDRLQRRYDEQLRNE